MAAAPVSDYVQYMELGSGAFGTVFKVKKNGHGRFFAMKRVLLDRTSNVDRELESQESFSKHNNVVSLVDSHFSRKYLYLVMDYCNNGTLGDFILENDVEDSLLTKLMGDMIRGLKHLHDHNIVHRDIKPDNILLHFQSGKKLICKLSDFGLARYSGDSGNSCYDQSYYLQTGCGTPCFIAPEVLTSHYTEACDIFSLGVVFYAIQATELEESGGYLIATVDERTPFHQASYKRIKQRVNSQVKRRGIADVIKSMLHKNYHDRVDVDDLDLNFKMATL